MRYAATASEVTRGLRIHEAGAASDAQQGDAVAYEKLLAELLPQMRGFMRNRVFDVEAQEDVVQNVFLSVHRARHTCRAERPFTPWVCLSPGALESNVPLAAALLCLARAAHVVLGHVVEPLLIAALVGALIAPRLRRTTPACG